MLKFEAFKNTIQVDDWPALFNDACQLAFQLGPYIGVRNEVAIKLIRLLNIFNEDPEAENLAEFDDCKDCKLIFKSIVIVRSKHDCGLVRFRACAGRIPSRFQLFILRRTLASAWPSSLSAKISVLSKSNC